jgi:hypothetical protein
MYPPPHKLYYECNLGIPEFCNEKIKSINKVISLTGRGEGFAISITAHFVGNNRYKHTYIMTKEWENICKIKCGYRKLLTQYS